MKILLLITKSEIGGAQNFVIDLARGLHNQGHEVVVGCGVGDYLQKKLAPDQIPVQVFKNLKRTDNPLRNFSFIFEFAKYLKNNKFDVIHFNSSNTLFGVLSNLISGHKAKTIFTVHGLSLIDEFSKTGWLKKSIYFLYFKIFLRLTDWPVFVSKHNQNFAKKTKLTHRGAMIYYGLDNQVLNFLEKNMARKKLAEITHVNLDNVYLLGSIGRLATQKNYDFLIKIFPDIKKIDQRIKLLIIGSGPEENKYRTLINDLNLKNDIYLVGALEDAYQYLPAFDLFVLPSIYEGLPITLLEARQANLTILTSNVGGNAEIVEKPEYLFTLDDKADFLNKLEYLVKNQVSCTYPAKFSQDAMVSEYLKIYQT